MMAVKKEFGWKGEPKKQRGTFKKQDDAEKKRLIFRRFIGRLVKNWEGGRLLTDIEKVEQKITALVKRREIIEGNIKRLTIESKKMEKRTAALEAEKKRLLCGKFGELLEKNAISIQDIDLDEIVKAISANKDVYRVKNIKAVSADEAETADKIADNIETESMFSQVETEKQSGRTG